jgi:hypothetical protein
MTYPGFPPSHKVNILLDIFDIFCNIGRMSFSHIPASFAASSAGCATAGWHIISADSRVFLLSVVVKFLLEAHEMMTFAEQELLKLVLMIVVKPLLVMRDLSFASFSLNRYYINCLVYRYQKRNTKNTQIDSSAGEEARQSTPAKDVITF